MNFLRSALVLSLCLMVCPCPSGAEEGRAGSSIVSKAPVPKLESSPTDVRAKTELYLFLGWMWILIFIVLYVLRQKAKQADDLVRYRFFDEPEPPSPPRTIA